MDDEMEITKDPSGRNGLVIDQIRVTEENNNNHIWSTFCGLNEGIVFHGYVIAGSSCSNGLDKNRAIGMDTGEFHDKSSMRFVLTPNSDTATIKAANIGGGINTIPETDITQYYDCITHGMYRVVDWDDLLQLGQSSTSYYDVNTSFDMNYDTTLIITI